MSRLELHRLKKMPWVSLGRCSNCTHTHTHTQPIGRLTCKNREKSQLYSGGYRIRNLLGTWMWRHVSSKEPAASILRADVCAIRLYTLSIAPPTFAGRTACEITELRTGRGRSRVNSYPESNSGDPDTSIGLETGYRDGFFVIILRLMPG
jgi:hypothetical protein